MSRPPACHGTTPALVRAATWMSSSVPLVPRGGARGPSASSFSQQPRIAVAVTGGGGSRRDACSRRRDVAGLRRQPLSSSFSSSLASSFSSSLGAAESSLSSSSAPPSSSWPPDPSLLPLGPAAPFLRSVPSPEQIVAVNFYHLVDLPSPRATRKRHEAFLRGRDVRGRIYVAPQGINAQFSAPAGVAAEYLIWVRNESEGVPSDDVDDESASADDALAAARASASKAVAASFRDTMRANSEPSPLGEHLFPKLRLKYKPNLISLAGGTASLPITRPDARAAPLSPREWETMLLSGDGDGSKKPIVLDVRNAYEWDAGHFVGAERPLEDNFCETPTGTKAAAEARERTARAAADTDDDDEDEDATSDADERSGLSPSTSSDSGSRPLDVPSYLSDVPKDSPVMMYCTGGIRCDIYSAHLRQKGFTNLYTLEGGVHNYFNQVGGRGWNGSLFVFDARMAVAPKNGEEGGGEEGCGEEGGGEEGAVGGVPEGGGRGRASAAPAPMRAAAPCLLCGGEGSLPHLNCSNIDCNRLFISCERCAERLRGCCCDECTSAPRLLRPAKVRGYFGSWQSEAAAAADDPEAALAAARAAMSSGRGPGRLARRRARAERLSAERAAAKEARLSRKASARAELAKREEQGGRGGASGGIGESKGLADAARERSDRLAKLEELRSRLLVRR